MTTGGRRDLGFTIVETLIVLAVSAGLAVSAMLLIAGRQNKTEFQVAINGEQQAIQQLINETASGFYPHATTFTCSGATSPVSFSQIGSASPTPDQGANSGCVFLGKVVAFGLNITQADSASSIVYPLIGNQQQAGADVQTFAQAHPLALGPDHNLAGQPVVPDLSVQSTLLNGLTFQKAVYHYASGDKTNPAASQKPLAVLVFAPDLGASSTGSGTQNLDLFGYHGSDTWQPTTSENLVKTNLNSGTVEESTTLNSIDLCFASGSTNQSGLISVSGKGQLSVTLAIKDGTTC